MDFTNRVTNALLAGVLLLLVFILAGLLVAEALAAQAMEIPGTTRQQVLETYGKAPLSFEANRGQSDPRVKFLARGSWYTLYLTLNEAVLALREAKQPAASEQSVAKPHTAVLRMKLIGANSSAQVAGLDELPGKVNYFLGNDRTKWRTGVPTYAKVKYG